MKYIRKRGISTIITMILLILLSLAAILIVYTAVKRSIESSSGKLDKVTTCIKEVDLKITDSCYVDTDIPNYLNIRVKNMNGFDYGCGNFILKILREGVTDKENPNVPGCLYGLEERTFPVNVENPGDVDKFIFVPTISGPEGFYCYDRAIEFTSKPC